MRLMERSQSDWLAFAKAVADMGLLLWLFFVRFELQKVVVEPVKALLPEAAVVVKPVVHRLKLLWVELARTPLRIPPAGDQARILQHLKMTGDGREANVEGL